MLKKTIPFLVQGLLLALSAATAQASVIVLNFEGINATYPSGYATVEDFYNGGNSGDGTSGTNFGISFGDNALAICLNTPGTSCSNTSRGGLGDPNSQLGALFFLDGTETTMDVAAGFDTGFSFFYTAIGQGGSVTVWDELGGTGTLLATLTLPLTTSACDSSYNAGFCPFVAAGVSFSGTAKSVQWGGVANQVVFDDVTLGSATPGNPGNPVPAPATLALLGAGFAGLSLARRRRKA